MGGVFGGGDASVPPPPPMSGEEKALLNQQTQILQQMSGLLGTSAAQNQESQDLYRQLSGLYEMTGEDTPGAISLNQDVINAGLSAPNDKTLKSMAKKYNPDKATREYAQRFIDAGFDDSWSLQHVVDALKADPEKALKLGFATQTEGTKRGYTLKQSAVDELKTRLGDYQKKADEISSLQTDRYMKALKGELPVSEGTTQRKAKDFSLLKEAAARRGNVIEGDAPEGAFGLSSAAAANLGEFNRTYGLIQDAERRGELAAGGAGGSPAAMPLGYASGAGAYSPASLLPAYSGLAGGYGAAAQPYTDYRNMQYQGQLQNAALQMQGQGAFGGLLGMAGGSLLGAGKYGPGAGLLGAGYLLSR